MKAYVCYEGHRTEFGVLSPFPYEILPESVECPVCHTVAHPETKQAHYFCTVHGKFVAVNQYWPTEIVDFENTAPCPHCEMPGKRILPAYTSRTFAWPKEWNLKALKNGDKFTWDWTLRVNPEDGSATVIEEQPMPTGDGEIVYPLVIEDIMKRVRKGKRDYGTYLRANNGRNALKDAYEEALDLVMYLRQALLEQEEDND